MSVEPRLRRLVSLVLWLAIAYFFAVVLRQVDWRAVASHRLNVPLALLVLVLGTANRFFLPAVWTMVLSSLEGKPLRIRALLWPYAESWMARYLPGKVGLHWHAGAGRRAVRLFEGERDHQRWRRGRAAGRLGDGAQHRAAQPGPAISLAVQRLAGRRNGRGVVGPHFAAGASAGRRSVPASAEENRCVRFVSVVDDGICLRDRAGGDVRRAVASIRSLLAKSLDLAVSAQWALFLGAIFLSSIAGMVAFFSPGGIGVRELVFVQLLQPWYPKEQLVIFVIFWRLAETVMDLLFAVIAES